MSANPYRGEVAVTLDGQEYTLRPTFAAMVEIERGTGMGFPELTARMLTGKYTVEQLAAVLAAGLNAARDPKAPPYKLADVGELMFKTGISNPAMIESIGAFLGACANGGVSSDGAPGEAKAPGGKGSRTGA